MAMNEMEPETAGEVEHVDVVIIGGGSGGIVALKEMVTAGVTRVVLLEREAGIGDLLLQGYDGLRLRQSVEEVARTGKDDWSIRLVGCAPFGSRFPSVEMHARFVARNLKGALRLPDATSMRQMARCDVTDLLQQFGNAVQRVGRLLNYVHYLDQLAKMIRQRTHKTRSRA